VNLFSALTDHLAPADVFLETSDRLWTFGDIVELSSVIGGGLVAAGVGAGDRVVVVLEKSAYAVALYLACLRIGAIFVPLNPAYTASEISYFVGDAKPAVVVATEPWPDMTTLILNRNGSGTLLQADHRFDTVVDRTPTDIAALLYTSGTTGEPKGAMLTHGCLLENARTLFEIWQWQPDDVLLHALPIFHVHGLFVALHCALLGGSRVVFLDRFDSDTVRDFLPSATVMMGVPTYYTRLLTNPAFGPSDCVNMRLFISGSAPLSEAAFFAFRSRTGHTILERYGMTEAGMICSNPYDGERLAGTVGFPLPRYLLRVADGHDQALPAGEVGILQIQGPSLFGGYWKRPEQTAESFTSDGYFRTGDLARSDTDGRISLLGRSHDLIVTGGFNVYPKEVERVLNEVPGVVESAVVGAPDADLGEIPVAFVVGDCEEAALRTHADRHLARYKQPRRYEFLDAIPRNAMGKVQKSHLRSRESDPGMFF